ncbi:MAG: cyclic nucleotide-binding domain-containing protein [Desulfobacteraceae bacterium]|nr:cyclic nucleotide-binding domain-containing protein [Desulfobacteraceae bacterium]
MELKKLEHQIRTHLENGNKDRAVRAVYEAVIYFAKNKEFTKAEALRDKIYEIDPLALTEIVESAEIIEREKNDAIDKNHQSIFKKLYTDLTSEEGNALFFSMKEEQFSSDDVFFRQGEKNKNLYFVNKGSLKIIHKKDQEDIFIREVTPGNIAGTESFFKTTVCTNTLVGSSQGSCHVLNKERLDKLKEEFPGLEPKLRDFAFTLKTSSALLQEKGVNRRVHKRFSTNGAIVFQILSASGKSIGKVLKGRLSDVSSGGLSFYFTTSNERNVKLLLGRELMMKFIIPESKNRVDIKKKGQVLSVLPQMNHEYSIHLQFDNLLDPKFLM